MSDIGYQMSGNQKSEGGYHSLEVCQAAHALGVRIHAMTLKLPKFEIYEEGSQIRRSGKSIASLIVEGYAQRKDKAQFLLYLYKALGSADETQEHLRHLIETGSLQDKAEGEALRTAAGDVSRKLVHFIKGIEREHDARPLLKVAAELDGETEDLDLTSESPTSDILTSDIRKKD